MESGSMQAEKIWNIAADILKKQSQSLYRLFFSKMTALSVEEETLSLGVPDDFFREMVIDNYSDLITDALAKAAPECPKFTLISGITPKATEINDNAVSAAGPVVPTPTPSPRRNSQIYSFDNFVCGYTNRHAFAMARSTAEAPGEYYNPLFIYGSNGVGKTHLLQAIAGKITAERPDLIVCNTTCDNMLNDFYDLIVNKRGTAEFRSGMCNADVLLVDDIHRLEKKPVLQEEFFNIFNSLYQQGKQIVLTSDRQPCEFTTLSPRLSSRFEQGMICQVGMPEYEQRLVILRMWRQESMTTPPLPDDILEFLAENISSTVRRLRGCFYRLSAYASLSGTENISIAEAEDLLHAQLAEESKDRDIRPETIQQMVADHFGITLNEMLGKCRSKNIADPRMIAMYLCRKHTRLSSNEIGDVFGRTHANVLHAAKTIPIRCASDDIFRRTVSQLERQFQK